MVSQLNWQRDDKVLKLEGELTSETLLPLWEQRSGVASGVEIIDFSSLTRVDTAGLALLIHLIGLAKQQGNDVELRQMSENLYTLVQLYNLPESLFPHCSA
ncbi:lipid asymmetry maintenance protein MlaB [Klebsiella sp. BIGb0407]|uniref:lipid asymmetry maintenance protein MlaB n=1 Tax=Klebsiella sp. BIGb0407 TaxID=2940603 RepID=UPI00216727E1|nr:lipid asymmetry maintenance protein MlaB [Klebsiella sp. BIGb0407]MCS3433248.1 phospholipid transport system transporter-binding protein [Klebsiella sp. BIGb0407]